MSFSASRPDSKFPYSFRVLYFFFECRPMSLEISNDFKKEIYLVYTRGKKYNSNKKKLKTMEKESRIVVNPKVMVGKPVIKGTRIPVDAIIKRLAEGMSIKEILEEYPNLKEEDVKAALEYAAKVVSGEEVMPLMERV